MTAAGEIIRRCLTSTQFREHVERSATHGRVSLFVREGRPDRDDVEWLSRVASLSEAVRDDLYNVPDWRAFYAILLRLPEFAFAREAIGEAALERLLAVLGPPVTMEWTADRRPEPGPHAGNFDAIERGLARGWVWHPGYPNQPAEIEFVVAGQVVHTARASYLRPDVRADGRGSGFAGFETQLPYDLVGSELAIGARLSRSAWQLADSPKRLEIPPELRRWRMRRVRVVGPLLSWLRWRLDRATQGAELRFVLPIDATTRETDLLRTIAGLGAQWCSRWRLICLADGSVGTEILNTLHRACVADARIELSTGQVNLDEVEQVWGADPQIEARLLVPISCGDETEPDTVHRFLCAALTGAEIVYAGEIDTLDALLDAILPFRRAAFAPELLVSDPARTNLVGYAAHFARTILTGRQLPSGLAADDFAASAADRASVIMHVPALLRWRTIAGDNAVASLCQLTSSRMGKIATSGPELRFTLGGEPARQIVLTGTGLVPRSDVVERSSDLEAYPQISTETTQHRRKRLQLESEEIAAHIANLRQSISFVVRIDSENDGLRSSTIESLRQGRFPNWRLEIGGHRDDEVTAGTYLLWINAGEILHDHALYWFAARAAAVPDADIIYADQDEPRTDGVRSGLKPDWSPDLLESCDYIDSAVAFRLSSARAHLDVCRGRYDLLLRLTDTDLSRVEHIREVALYRPEGLNGRSLASREALDLLALGDRLTRSGRVGAVAPVRSAASPTYVITLNRKTRPPVSAVLALAAREQRIEDAGRYEIAATALIEVLRVQAGLDLTIVVDTLNVDRLAMAARSPNVRVLEYGRDLPSLAAMINQGAENASADLLLILDGPYGLGEPDTLDRLVDQFAKPSVGVAGARVRQRDAWRDAVTLKGGYPSVERSDDGEQKPTSNALAVLAPLMTTRALFETEGGYSEDVSSRYCHVDYCFKARRSGHRITFASNSHFTDWRPGTMPSEPDVAALRRLAERWPRAMMTDPYASSRT